MGSAIRFLGKGIVLPKGFRISPGANKRNICIGAKLAGTKPGSRAAAKEAFVRASDGCK